MAQISKKACSINGCEANHYGKGLCGKHYKRLLTTGTVEDGPRAPAPVANRFWRYVEKTTSCWIWTGNKASNGYGRIQKGGKGSPHIGAHRLSYEMHYGEIPKGMVVMHSCDSPSCVNPAHLSVGTYSDNTADMTAKGRRRGRMILTLEQVAEIRGSSEPARVFAARLGVSKSTIWAVRTGQNWKEK